MTERRREFVRLFLGDAKLVSVRAARMAGFACPRTAGPRLMAVPEIAAAIEQGFQAMLAESRAREARRLAGCRSGRRRAIPGCG